MSSPMAAERFPAGEFLADELEAREMSQVEFAEILGRPTQFVSEIISGKKEMTRESAAQIGAALGTSAELWLGLQDAYFLWLQQRDPEVHARLEEIRLRASMREVAPLNVLVKRGFVADGSAKEQERDVRRLLGNAAAGDESGISFVARRTDASEKVSSTQRAWVACVRAVARELPAAPFDSSALETLAKKLTTLAREPAAFARFQELLAEVGVKLVYLEAFPGGKLDGCATIMDETPVIGLSGRGKRLDKILFTLLHEVAHVLLGHLDDSRQTIVDDLNEDATGYEAEADALAGELAIPREIPDPPRRIGAEWIRSQAEDLQVHPLVLIGRLQRDGVIPWKSTLARGAENVDIFLSEWRAPLPTHVASSS